VGRGPERAQGQGMPKKTLRPRPLSGAGRGKGPGARIFRGPVRPLTNSIYEHRWKIFSPVQRSASKVPAVDDILNPHEATRMEVAMARKHSLLRQTVQADKRHKPLTEPFKKGSRVLVRGRPYTSSAG